MSNHAFLEAHEAASSHHQTSELLLQHLQEVFVNDLRVSEEENNALSFQPCLLIEVLPQVPCLTNTGECNNLCTLQKAETGKMALALSSWRKSAGE